MFNPRRDETTSRRARLPRHALASRASRSAASPRSRTAANCSLHASTGPARGSPAPRRAAGAGEKDASSRRWTRLRLRSAADSPPAEDAAVPFDPPRAAFSRASHRRRRSRGNRAASAAPSRAPPQRPGSATRRREEDAGGSYSRRTPPASDPKKDYALRPKLRASRSERPRPFLLVLVLGRGPLLARPSRGGENAAVASRAGEELPSGTSSSSAAAVAGAASIRPRRRRRV